MSNAKKITFESVKIGMGATEHVGSDCYPYTVVEVNASGKTIVLQQDKATPTDKHEYFGTQDYKYGRNKNGSKITATWRAKHGLFRLKGSTGKGCGWIRMGSRRYYSDPSF